jgi:hypothetical protein
MLLEIYFNSGGHEIDVKSLTSVCWLLAEGHDALGNPVKDSMEGKLSEQTTAVVGVIYSPKSFVSALELEEPLSQFAELLTDFGVGQQIRD